MSNSRSSSAYHIWLTLRTHAWAIWLFPRRYALAAYWRVLGKRVRARSQFAPLLARTPLAYESWILRHEQAAETSRVDLPVITALVAETGNEQDLASTLTSLNAEGVNAYCVGLDAAHDLQRIIDLIDWSSGPWLLPMVAGDLLAVGAISSYHGEIGLHGRHVIFADDDLIDARGRRASPHLKPDWNSELFSHFDYLTGSCIVRGDKARLASVASKSDWAARLVAVTIGVNGRAGHVHKVLHHRRKRQAPALPIAELQTSQELPRLSVIIPTRNRYDLLSKCIAGLYATEYPDLEILVVDNDSDDPETLKFLDGISADGVRVLHYGGQFNYSAINNYAVREASGKLICLLNNDIEILHPDWLAVMATQALREDVGAVGAQLVYPDNRIQHAGVVVGVGGGAAHAHRLLEPGEDGYFRRHAVPQFVSAVTAACLVVQRERFLAVDGLDETNFPVAFNDVDLCMKMNQRGWQSIYDPRAKLVHHESVSRGFDKDPVGAARFAGELRALKRRWKTDFSVDQFHHPHLSRVSEQFVLAL